MKTSRSFISAAILLGISLALVGAPPPATTRVSIVGRSFHLNGAATYIGTRAQGLFREREMAD